MSWVRTCVWLVVLCALKRQVELYLQLDTPLPEALRGTYVTWRITCKTLHDGNTQCDSGMVVRKAGVRLGPRGYLRWLILEE